MQYTYRSLTSFAWERSALSLHSNNGHLKTWITLDTQIDWNKQVHIAQTMTPLIQQPQSEREEKKKKLPTITSKMTLNDHLDGIACHLFSYSPSFVLTQRLPIDKNIHATHGIHEKHLLGQFVPLKRACLLCQQKRMKKKKKKLASCDTSHGEEAACFHSFNLTDTLNLCHLCGVKMQVGETSV